MDQETIDKLNQIELDMYANLNCSVVEFCEGWTKIRKLQCLTCGAYIESQSEMYDHKQLYHTQQSEGNTLNETKRRI